MKANLRYWTSVLREAERELEAATTRTAMNEAASKLMGAKVKLRRLQTPVSVSDRPTYFRPTSSRPPPAAPSGRR